MKIIYISLLLLACGGNVFSQEAFFGYINDDNVRVRSGPSLESSILTKINRNQKVNIKGGVRNITQEIDNYYYWIFITIDSLEGYVYSKYINTDYAFSLKDEGDNTIATADFFDNRNTWFVVSDNANVYDLNMKIINQLTKGTPIDTNYHYGDETENYKYMPITIHKNKVMRLLPFIKDEQIYLISDQDISNNFYQEDGSLYYSCVSYKIRSIKKLESDITSLCVPVYKIIKENRLGRNVIWQSSEIIQDNGSEIEQLIAFMKYGDIFVLDSFEECVGSWKVTYQSESISIYVLERNNLIKKKTVESYFRDGE